jgi:hypothetical protein
VSGLVVPFRLFQLLERQAFQVPQRLTGLVQDVPDILLDKGGEFRYNID